MDIQTYLNSGNLELYALGLLSGAEKNEAEEYILKYPQIRAELDRIELQLEGAAVSSGIEPSVSLREKVLNRIFGEGIAAGASLPLISKTSDHREWLRLVSRHIPEDFTEGCYSRVLQQTGQLMQTLLVSSTDFDDEVHEDLHESFLILEGKCKCTVGDVEFFMEAGDYTEIPLDAVHRVEIVKKPVIAILQRVSL